MTHSRLDLQRELVSILGSDNVYFQPPASLLMKYPCIRYEFSGHDVKFADDEPYHITKEYKITLIDKNPDNTTVDRLAQLPLCRLNQVFTADNLYHYVFTLYY